MKMATKGSAELLGRKDIGCLAQGMAADLFAISADCMELVCADADPANLFGTVGYHLPAELVFVNGKQTVEKGRLCNVDEAALAEEARKEVSRLLSA